MPDNATPVTLRELEESDLESVHGFLSDWNVVRYTLLPYCQSRDDSRKYFQELVAQSTGAWLSIVRAIECQDSGDVIGLCGIVILHGSEQGEIWYLVRQDQWGRGIAAESARGLLKIGFVEMNLHRMFATCLPENPASSRVLEKIGMRKEGHQLKNLKIHGTWHDCFYYAILREEWEARNATALLKGGGNHGEMPS